VAVPNKLLHVVVVEDLEVVHHQDHRQLLVPVVVVLELSQGNRRRLLVVLIQIMEIQQLKILEKGLVLEEHVELVYKIQFLEQLLIMLVAAVEFLICRAVLVVEATLILLAELGLLVELLAQGVEVPEVVGLLTTVVEVEMAVPE
jgi:hypothetical protein